MLNNWLKFKQNIQQNLLAGHCTLCAANRAEDCGICADCLGDLPWQPVESCPQCALLSLGAQVCGACLRVPPFFDVTHAVFTYDYPIDSLMAAYKYGDHLNLSHTFGRLLHEKITQNKLLNSFAIQVSKLNSFEMANSGLNNIDLIIPMPMHPTRLKLRGFNQAIEIARVFKAFKLDYRSVTRQKLTPPQASLPLKARVKNIKGVFAVQADLTGKRIAIIDDVMTSGASLNELAKTLKKAGASHVECWVIARTLPHT
jgi:ComF family protein